LHLFYKNAQNPKKETFNPLTLPSIGDRFEICPQARERVGVDGCLWKFVERREETWIREF